MCDLEEPFVEEDYVNLFDRLRASGLITADITFDDYATVDDKLEIIGV